MRDASHRDLIFLDVVVGASADHAPVRDLHDLMRRIALLFQERATAYWRNRGTRKIYLGRLSFANDGSCVAMLVKCTSGNIPDESYANLHTDVERPIPKGEDEGKPESVHLLLSLVNEPSQRHRYFAVLEGGDVLTRALIEDYLNHLLRKVGQADKKSFSCPLPTGEVDKASGKLKTARYDSTVDLQGHPADSFKADLANGRLTGIDLVKALPDGGGAGGEAPYVRAARITTKLAATTSWKDHPFESLASSITLAKQGKHDAVRVRFNSADRMSHTVTLDPDTGNVMGDAFVKKVRIGPFRELKTDARRELDPEVVQPMIGLLNTQRTEDAKGLTFDSFVEEEVADSGLVSDTQTVLLPDDQERAEAHV